MKNDIGEHQFGFMKEVQSSNTHLYLMDGNDTAWIHESDVVGLIPFPDITRRGEYKWKEKLGILLNMGVL